MLVFRFANRFIEPVLNAGARRRDPDHRGRDARRRRPFALLRRHRRAARHDPEPSHADDDVRHDGTAGALGRGDDPRPQGRGAEGGARASIPRSTRCAASTRPGSSTASRASRIAPNPASIRTSRTDTFAAVQLHVDTWRWEGIPVLLRSGKRLAAKAHEVAFRFREPPTRLFRHTPLEHAEPNWLVFRMSPTECTELVVRTKQPGLELEARESVLRAEYADADDQRGERVRVAAARRARGRPHAVPALRRGRVVVAHRRPDPQGVEARRARGLRRRQRRPAGPTPLPRPRPLLAAAANPRVIRTSRRAKPLEPALRIGDDFCVRPAYRARVSSPTRRWLVQVHERPVSYATSSAARSGSRRRSPVSSAPTSRSRSSATTAAGSVRPTTRDARSSCVRRTRCATSSPRPASSASPARTSRASSTSRATSSRRSRCAITCPTCKVDARRVARARARASASTGLRPLPPPPEEARAARSPAQQGARRGRDRAPLRRVERLLPAGARPVDDVLVRGVRDAPTRRSRPRRRAKYELVCRKLGLQPGHAAARRRLRLGRHGDARRASSTACARSA